MPASSMLVSLESEMTKTSTDQAHLLGTFWQEHCVLALASHINSRIGIESTPWINFNFLVLDGLPGLLDRQQPERTSCFLWLVWKEPLMNLAMSTWNILALRTPLHVAQTTMEMCLLNPGVAAMQASSQLSSHTCQLTSQPINAQKSTMPESGKNQRRINWIVSIDLLRQLTRGVTLKSISSSTSSMPRNNSTCPSCAERTARLASVSCVCTRWQKEENNV